MPDADRAVHAVLRKVLKPEVVERAMQLAIDALSRDDEGTDGKRTRLTRQLEYLNIELDNLSDAAAKGGAVPVILKALNEKDAERRELARQIDALDRSPVADSALRRFAASCRRS